MAEENQMNQGPVVPPQTGIIGEQETRQLTESGLAERGHNVESSGTEQATENLTQATRVTGGEVLDDARKRLRTLKRDTDDYVRKKPAKAVLTALAIGFVLGLMRRH
jgi:Bacterial protein of unknown function (DUF883).